MRLLDKTFLTEDEQYDIPSNVSGQVEEFLSELKFDSYNEIYVIRITVDKIDNKIEN